VNKWCTIAPISYWKSWNFIKEPFEFEKGIILRPAPSWLTQEDMRKELGFYSNIIDSAKFALIREYEAGSMGETDPSWQGKKTRSKQNIADELIKICSLSLWLAKPSSFKLKILIHSEQINDKWYLRTLYYPRPLLSHERDCDNRLKINDLNLARKLFSSINCLTRNGPIWRAIWAVYAALSEIWEIRYMLLWIALESIFGPKDAREIRYKLSQRIAFFLSSSRKEALNQFEVAKCCYDWRCKVVHGLRMDSRKQNKSEEILYKTECLIRKTLNKILINHKLIEKFNNDKEREKYLDALPFNSNSFRE